jgi:hypothetical protein
MTPDIRRTLVIDAAIVAVVVVLAFVLFPGVAMIGIVALVVLILGGISFAFSELRARRRRRRRRVGARRLAVASGRSPYGSPRDAGLPGPGRAAGPPPEKPAVRRVPASRRTQAQRKPLR